MKPPKKLIQPRSFTASIAWLIAAPPPPGQQCRQVPRLSQPVASYRISPVCGITDVQGVGAYKYGLAEVQAEIRGFETSDTVRRFVNGRYELRLERRIELHKALEPPETLVCETDMMKTKVFSAHIIRTEVLDKGRTVKVKKPLQVKDGELPDLGVFTHTKDVHYTTKECR